MSLCLRIYLLNMKLLQAFVFCIWNPGKYAMIRKMLTSGCVNSKGFLHVGHDMFLEEVQ